MSQRQSFSNDQRLSDALEGLDKIPEMADELCVSYFKEVQEYLEKAFLSRLHPLGQLRESLVDAFRATYGGVGTHPRLLKFAIDEVRLNEVSFLGKKISFFIIGLVFFIAFVSNR